MLNDLPNWILVVESADPNPFMPSLVSFYADKIKRRDLSFLRCQFSKGYCNALWEIWSNRGKLDRIRHPGAVPVPNWVTASRNHMCYVPFFSESEASVYCIWSLCGIVIATGKNPRMRRLLLKLYGNLTYLRIIELSTTVRALLLHRRCCHPGQTPLNGL